MPWNTRNMAGGAWVHRSVRVREGAVALAWAPQAEVFCFMTSLTQPSRTSLTVRDALEYEERVRSKTPVCHRSVRVREGAVALAWAPQAEVFCYMTSLTQPSRTSLTVR